MTSRVVLRHEYPEPPESMREVLADGNYLRDKLRTVGGPQDELVSREVDQHGVTIVLHHTVSKDVLPSFLRSALPNGLKICRTEIWTGSGGSLEAVVDEAPAKVAGTMQLEPAPTGCVLSAQLTADVELPLFSSKVEKIITDNVGKLLEAEYRFTLGWLRNGTA
ncbi:MAG: DUF2505 domain-containing protein [Pseudonocardiaceae bacterium]